MAEEQETKLSRQIKEAMAEVEHPEIAMTLEDLGMVRDIQIDDKNVVFTLVVPFLGIPEAVRNYMINSLGQAIEKAGGQLEKVYLEQMTDEERQAFFGKEKSGWREGKPPEWT
jgi:metal-sulfur cluster biosynthetic enzyme